MPIRIGANPICWSNDDMREVGGSTPLEQCLSEAKEAGFEGIELGNKFPREAAELRPILAAHGLALVGGWHSIFLLGREADIEFAEAEAHRRLLKDMGTNVFIVAECTGTVHGTQASPLSSRPFMTGDEWALFNTRLTRLAELLAAEGFVLVYHHHMGTVVQTEAEIDRLMDGTGPAVRLLLDTGHATWAGADPATLARRYRHRIAHVHAKDVRPDIAAEAGRRDLSFLDAVLEGVYTVPGDGSVDYPAVFRELKTYSGWVIIEAEQDPEKANPKTYVTMGYENLTRYLSEAGLR